MAWSCRSHSPPWSQIGQSSGWLMSRNSITPSRAFFTIGERVLSTFGEPSLFGGSSRTLSAQDACGFGMPVTSIRHMRQLPAIDSRSWKQKRGISAPAASQACSSVYSGGTSTSVPSTMILITEGSILLAVAPQAQARPHTVVESDGGRQQHPGDAPGQKRGHPDPQRRRMIGRSRRVKRVQPGLKVAALAEGGNEAGHLEIEHMERPGPLRI